MTPADKYKCAPCNLTIERDGVGYRFAKPGHVVPMILQDFKTLQCAYETGRCPLCGFEMTGEQAKAAGTGTEQ